MTQARTSDRPPEPALIWNVAGLLSDGYGAERTYPIVGVAIELPEELTLASPIDGQVRLSRTNRGILAEARLSTSLAGECSRCLRPLTTPVDIALDEEYLPSLDLATGRAVDTGDEPDAMRLTDHHEVDLEPSVRDAIVLAEPFAPLDRPDCPGLCVVCGLPLDEATHDHPVDDIDPRLEALRAFKPD